MTGTVDIAFLLIASLQREGGYALSVDEKTVSERRSNCTVYKLVEFGKQTYCPNSKCIPWAQGAVRGAVLFDGRARGTRGWMHLERCRHTHAHS